MLATMQAWMGLLVVGLVACGFQSEAARTHDAADAPATCDLVCGLNATCTVVGTAGCRCDPGFSGDGRACSDVDECTAGTSGCPGACLNTTGGFTCYAPRTCADVKAMIPTATDRTYTLYLDGDASKPWTADCARMTTTPVEYLSLAGTNLAQYTAGGKASGTTVTTTYTKVRFAPASHQIDISDRTFATSRGRVNHPMSGQPNIVVTSMPYGVAMDCAGAGKDTGVAQIDLSGTHFALMDRQQFATQGNGAAGKVELSSSRQQAKVTGGGSCGWTAPIGGPQNPFNDNVGNGVLLELAYVP